SMVMGWILQSQGEWLAAPVASIDPPHVTVARRGALVEQVEKILLQVLLTDEVGNHESGGSTLSVGPDSAGLPRIALPLDRVDAAEDVETEMLHCNLPGPTDLFLPAPAGTRRSSPGRCRPRRTRKQRPRS